MRIPYNYTPREYQLPLLEAMDSGIKRAIYIVHRRGGKDKTSWNLIIKKALERKGVYFYILPTYAQARKVIWDGIDKDGFRFLDHIPKEIEKKRGEMEMKVELVNGSIIQLVGADNIDRIVGTNPVGIVFSEYSLMRQEVWDFLRPILAENGGWAVFIFTPRGTNHAHALLSQAREDPNWYVGIYTVHDTKAIPEDVLAQEKKTMPQALYEQEYECRFIDGASQFFQRVIENATETFSQAEDGHTYQLGVDLAKYQDWTVITPFDLSTFQVGNQIRFNQIDWNLQKARIAAESRRYFLGNTNMDSTGLGDPIVDDLSADGIPITPFKFNQNSRKDLLNNLQILLSQDKIKIPNDQGLIDELRAMQFELSEQGKLKLETPDNVSDDRVMSLALAVWNCPQEPLGVNSEQGLSFYSNTRY